MYQCIENVKEGDSVQFEGKMYRVQNDKGWLYIYPTVRGKREKVGIERLLFNAGTMGDYVFNGWFQIYKSFEEFKNYMEWELTTSEK